MPQHEQPKRQNLGSAAKRAINRAKKAVRSLTSITPATSSSNPFADALREASEQPEGAMSMLAKHTVTLSPLEKRRQFPDLGPVPEGMTLGWVQLRDSDVQGFSLGVFTDRTHYAQIAFADRHGRVFVGADLHMDVQDMEPAFMFAGDHEITLQSEDRLKTTSGGRAIAGGIVGREDKSGRMIWLASWLKSNNRYALEQMRTVLPESMRKDLEYRDALTIAFFAVYMLPKMNGLLMSFGTDNIMRHLTYEAPLAALRRSARDIVLMRAHGMRTSGLEDYFLDLMHEVNVIDGSLDGLEAEHGAEPLALHASKYSHARFLSWEETIPFSSMLKALHIEGNINRLITVGLWLNYNGADGKALTEDTVTRAQAAQIDMRLLENPAIMAFKRYTGDERMAAYHVVEVAHQCAEDLVSHTVDPMEGDGRAAGEWVYRQTLSKLLRTMYLPYRFDVEFRSNLQAGKVALGFTTAGASMMPKSRYDEERHAWRQLSDAERAAMSTDYNLRVGLMMAALAFGVDERVEQVSLHIDSIGLEEVVAEQDATIARMLSQALRAFDHLRAGDIGVTGSKADPKDGDIHGDVAQVFVHDTSLKPSDALDRHLDDMTSDFDVDAVAFAEDVAGVNHDAAADDESDTTNTLASGNPMDELEQNPTVRTMAAVTLTRDEFLDILRTDGITHPLETYQHFGATMQLDEHGALTPVKADFDLHDAAFSPEGSQQEPELIDYYFSSLIARLARVPENAEYHLGAENTMALSIQREDLLQRAMNEFRALASNDTIDSVTKAKRAMQVIEDIRDPELTALSSQVTSALIDGKDVPALPFTVVNEINKERARAHDLLFSGHVDESIQVLEDCTKRFDAMFAQGEGVPRYFNSYAERVIYNRLFATEDEMTWSDTVLIPDELFQAHLELTDIFIQTGREELALPHLTAMVQYAPAYPLVHMRLSVQLARMEEDWDSARAACLNALRVSLDQDDAAFAYYRLAYAEWMLDRFDIAAACYILADTIAPGQIAVLRKELHELLARVESQGIPGVPTTIDDARRVLREYDMPVWPFIEAADIVRAASRVCVDEGLFVPARTLAMAVARMGERAGEGINAVQAQFLRSLAS